MKKDQEFNGHSVDKWIASRLFLGCAGVPDLSDSMYICCHYLSIFGDTLMDIEQRLLKLTQACEYMLEQEKLECVRNGTSSRHGLNVNKLLKALNKGSLYEWLQSDEYALMVVNVGRESVAKVRALHEACSTPTKS